MAGIGVGAVGQLLLVAGVISLQLSFVTGGLGILPVLAWVAALAVVALRDRALPPELGWMSVALLAFVGLEAVGSVALPETGLLITSIGLLLVLVGWLVALGRTCLQATGDQSGFVGATSAG